MSPHIIIIMFAFLIAYCFLSLWLYCSLDVSLESVCLLSQNISEIILPLMIIFHFTVHTCNTVKLLWDKRSSEKTWSYKGCYVSELLGLRLWDCCQKWAGLQSSVLSETLSKLFSSHLQFTQSSPSLKSQCQRIGNLRLLGFDLVNILSWAYEWSVSLISHKAVWPRNSPR